MALQIININDESYIRLTLIFLFPFLRTRSFALCVCRHVLILLLVLGALPFATGEAPLLRNDIISHKDMYAVLFCYEVPFPDILGGAQIKHSVFKNHVHAGAWQHT